MRRAAVSGASMHRLSPNSLDCIGWSAVKITVETRTGKTRVSPCFKRVARSIDRDADWKIDRRRRQPPSMRERRLGILWRQRSEPCITAANNRILYPLYLPVPSWKMHLVSMTDDRVSRHVPQNHLLNIILSEKRRSVVRVSSIAIRLYIRKVKAQF